MRLGVLLLLFASVPAVAQEPPCGVRTVRETAAAVYPALGRAARVSGDVLLHVNFDRDGKVDSVAVLNGPVMLQTSAVEFVRGWQANADDQPRSCDVTVSYVLDGDTGCPPENGFEGIPPKPATSTAGWVGVQQFVVVAPNNLTCDRSSSIRRRKKFLGIF